MKKGHENLREELILVLKGRGAHADFDAAVADIAEKDYGASVKEIPYTLWQLLEHIRLSQKDILDYIRDPHYKEGEWPEAYWPRKRAPASEAEWKKSIQHYHQDLQTLKNLVQDPDIQLDKPIPHIKDGPTYLHEILLVADHTAYHIGQIILLRRFLGIWKK